MLLQHRKQGLIQRVIKDMGEAKAVAASSKDEAFTWTTNGNIHAVQVQSYRESSLLAQFEEANELLRGLEGRVLEEEAAVSRLPLDRTLISGIEWLESVALIRINSRFQHSSDTCRRSDNPSYPKQCRS